MNIGITLNVDYQWDWVRMLKTSWKKMHLITVQRQAGKEYLVQDAFNTRNCSA